jgi:hypothetical protein
MAAFSPVEYVKISLRRDDDATALTTPGKQQAHNNQVQNAFQ